MTAIKFACFSPHPPIIVREVARGWEQKVQLAIAGSQALFKPHEPASLWRFEVRRLT